MFLSSSSILASSSGDTGFCKPRSRSVRSESVSYTHLLKDIKNKNFRSVLLRHEIDDLSDMVETSSTLYAVSYTHAMKAKQANDDYVLSKTLQGVTFDTKKTVDELVTEFLPKYDAEYKAVSYTHL